MTEQCHPETIIFRVDSLAQGNSAPGTLKPKSLSIRKRTISAVYLSIYLSLARENK